MPRSLPRLAAELKDQLDDNGKIALGLQLYTLVDAAGRSERSRTSFEVFMRRIGKPQYGQAILQEMAGEVVSSDELPFECLSFGSERNADVVLPPKANGHEFRVYRAGDLLLVRNVGKEPIWIRGRSLAPGSFLRMRARQQLVVPGWTLTYEDLIFFLNVRLTGNAPVLFLSRENGEFVVERVRSRHSVLRIAFGTKVMMLGLRPNILRVTGRGNPAPERVIEALYHEYLSDGQSLNVALHELRRQADEAGRRFRLTVGQQEIIVSNDPSALGSGDLLLSPGLAGRTVLKIRFDAREAKGTLEVVETERGIMVNGHPVRATTELYDGALIRISANQSIRCRFSEGLLDEERSLIQTLQVRDLIHDFGPQNRALDNLSFEVQRGEMLCIIGPSGSGKSTLLTALSGQLAPTRGHIRLNGLSLYDHLERLSPLIAYMPQEEALNPQLTVREHLRHASTIRRPHLSTAEHERRVDSILAELGLQSLARRRVGSRGEKTLSGGERSRLNLGLDLGSAAEIFLFDEPISGLSSKDSEHVAETLRSLALDKIVIASLHRPGPQVLRLFDKVLLIDKNGHLAFFGSPQAMIAYFREACEELGIAHPSISAKVPLGADFVFDVLETPLHAIGGGENTGAARRFPPSFWQERFESVTLVHSFHSSPTNSPPTRLGELQSPERMPIPVRRRRRLREGFALLTTHFQRSLLSKLRNKGTIYSTLLEAPILAAFIGITLRSSPEGAYDFATALHIPAYLFLTATVGMFLGLTNSATEILRDRPMLRRERNCRPGSPLYLAAKFGALALVAAVQCFTYIVVGNYFLEIRGMTLEHWFWMTLTAWTGTALALLISSLVKTERAALTSVPLLLVPQMLLAGALVPFQEMNRGLFQESNINRERGGVPVPASIMPLRYAYEAMVVTQATRNSFEIERDRIQRKIESMKEESPAKMSPEQDSRFRVLRNGLTKLLAAGASDPEKAEELATRITEVSRRGKRLEMETLKVWPDQDSKARPISEFYVNNRIDLLYQQAESFRTDIRNKYPRNVFLARWKNIGKSKVDTLTMTGGMLTLISTVCLGGAALAVGVQTRRTR